MSSKSKLLQLEERIKTTPPKYFLVGIGLLLVLILVFVSISMMRKSPSVSFDSSSEDYEDEKRK